MALAISGSTSARGKFRRSFIQVSHFGVRRQSAAPTALWILIRRTRFLPCASFPRSDKNHELIVCQNIQSAVAAALCRRTPNLFRCTTRNFLLFDLANLFHAPFMPAALELGVEPGAHNLRQLFGGRYARAERQDVRIVVFAS